MSSFKRENIINYMVYFLYKLMDNNLFHRSRTCGKFTVLSNLIGQNKKFSYKSITLILSNLPDAKKYFQ